MNNVKVGIVSGYFNPLHRGHLEYINSAKERCDYLICIVNNDDQVKIKAGYSPFMDEQHRLFIMSNIKAINKALVCIDRDSSVANTLRDIADSIPDKSCELFFFNSGDRSYDNENEQEINACKEKSITSIFINLPKVYSSSQLKLDFSTNNVK